MTSPWALRNMMDNWLRYFQPGLPVYLRVQNVSVDTEDAFALGFQPTVSGDSGITDYLISPPAEVLPVSTHDIGMSGGRLQFGAKTFSISNTWVLQRMSQMGYTDPYQVWRDPSVVGFYHDGRLYAIESVVHRDLASQAVIWQLVCNSLENASSSPLNLGVENAD